MKCQGNQCPALQRDVFAEIEASNPNVSEGTKAVVDFCDEATVCAYDLIRGMNAFTPKGLAEAAMKDVQIQRGRV